MVLAIIFKLFRYIAQVLSLGILLLQLVFVLPLLTPYMNISQYPRIKTVLQWEANTTSQIRSKLQQYIPTKYKQYDITRGLIILVLFIVDGYVVRTSGALRRKESYYMQKSSYDAFLTKSNIPEDSPLLKPLKEKLDQLETAKRKDRKRLIMDFMAIKTKLEELRRELSFLSVDVVDSTGMKRNEDPLAISADFYSYNDMLDDVLRENNCIRFAMTPDGTMACFPTVSDAINAAQAILHELVEFNQTKKTIKRDFNVRIGINAGPIYFDENEPLETISDRVIDIAGHLQKHAEPNTIYIAKAILPSSEKASAFVEIEKVIDEQQVLRWQKQHPTPAPTN